MKKFILSLLASLLIVVCFADTMTMDDTRLKKAQQFFTRCIPLVFIPKRCVKEPKAWWTENWWKRYICSKKFKFDVRKYHIDKIEKRIYELERKWPNVPNSSLTNAVGINFDKETINELLNGRFDVDIDFKIKDCIQKNCTGNLDVADISPIYVSENVVCTIYFSIVDIIYISDLLTVGIEKGHQQSLEWTASVILHEYMHKEKRHYNKNRIYYAKCLKMKELYKIDIDQIFTEYMQMQEREADILVCIEGGTKMCEWLKDYLIFLAYEESMSHEKMAEAGIDYNTNNIQHPPIQERIDYIEPISSDLKNDDDPNKCFNPDYEINGLPRWVDCGGYNKNITKALLALFKKMTC